MKSEQVRFDEWLEFLFFNRFTFTKIAVGIMLLVLIACRMAMVSVGTSAEFLFIAMAVDLMLVTLAVLHYRYVLDIKNPPGYMKEIIEERNNANNS